MHIYLYIINILAGACQVRALQGEGARADVDAQDLQIYKRAK